VRSAGHPGHQGTVGRWRASADAGPGPAGSTAGFVAGSVGPSRSVLTRAVCGPIRLYRALSANRLPHCRYWPTCSSYALESVETHGAGRGLWLALRRVARCHPWGGFGADPVPPRSPAPVTGGSRVTA
jgi:putative membrane protein insertion efficiency factor